jgi:ATP-binding cassette subfamily B protein
MKLIMRLYDPTGGSILFDRKALSEYPVNEYRKRIGALFQDFEIVAATVGQNVLMSTGSIDKEKALDVFGKVGFLERFKALVNGFDTPLTKEFESDGTNLSGGEAQKIAISRVLYSDANIIILDEPSSALDPIAEYTSTIPFSSLQGTKRSSSYRTVFRQQGWSITSTCSRTDVL